MKLALGLVVATVAGLAQIASADPKLDIIEFFSGKTQADNLVKIALHRPHKLTVESLGGRNKSGDLVLVETVQEEGKPARKRTWVMRSVTAGHFTGSLSDANGPVDVLVSGSSATIRYTMREGGLKIEQKIQLQRDGSLANHIIARKFGIRFAEVNGTIRKLD
jgi:hypothetical protein